MPRAFASHRVQIVFALTDRTNVARTCNVCWLSFPTRTIYRAHLHTPQHLHAVSLRPRRTFRRPRNSDFVGGKDEHASRSDATFCRICRVQCRNPRAYGDHLAGRAHALRLQNHVHPVSAVARVTAQRRQRGRWHLEDSLQSVLARETRRMARVMFFKAKSDRHYFPRAQAERARAQTQYKRRLFSARQRSHAPPSWAARREGRCALARALTNGAGPAPRRKDRIVYPCSVCGVPFFKENEYRRHVLSPGHAAAATSAAQPPSLPSWCAVCKVHLSLPHWAAYDKHVAGRSHQAQLTRLHDGTVNVNDMLTALPHA